MKILFPQWNGIGHEDMTEAFESLDHQVVKVPFSDDVKNEEKQKADLKISIKQNSPDCVFTFNFFPVIAKICNELNIPYISWTYDSPYVRLYNCTISYPTNYIFVFDSAVFSEFYEGGLKNVYYLPMAANTDRLKKLNDFSSFEKTSLANKTPISFVGSLYDEKHNFYERLENISDYTRGFIEGLMNAQKKVYGDNFIRKVLKNNPEILKDMINAYDMGKSPDGIETDEYMYANYIINRKITSIERTEQLTLISENFSLDLYTHNKNTKIPGCINHGPVDYYDYAPYVFKNSKINLNISLRSIINGIPLRCFEIMGSEGFLLSNYQQDFLNHFVPGEDFVYYESNEDLLDKISYYLKNENERKEIALNGFKKVEAEHTYVRRAEEMLSYIS
ncbi:MAG: glycosyltransferase [Lachnospiraceae bacterium]|nr:glycosyltransferase [Lachnospiraceae bacterium]